jgi:aconitate hydratase
MAFDGTSSRYFSVARAGEYFGCDFRQLPISLTILLENQLRRLDGSALESAVARFKNYAEIGSADGTVALMPSRVLMQDISGYTALLDLAALRQKLVDDGADPRIVKPVIPAHIVIDHSVAVDVQGTSEAMAENIACEFARHHERYAFFRWAQDAFDSVTVVPPGQGICHQVNLESLAQVVCRDRDGMLSPETVIGTDSHTTMINGIGVLGWGVGGIEAAAAMLGLPCEMRLPPVTGCRLVGKAQPGTTGTDIVLFITEMLRRRGVVGHFVEFFGEGLDHLNVANRAIIANMAPEYGATCGLFPIDDETLRYLQQTGRDEDHIRRVEAYARAQGLWRYGPERQPRFTQTIDINLAAVAPAVAGPSRPHDHVPLAEVAESFTTAFSHTNAPPDSPVKDGDVVLAAITSCTNTSNPELMIAAGLVARRARQLGLRCKPWVKTSLAPGSRVVADFLSRAGLQEDLDALGFNIVGFGCTTCVGNSGKLAAPIAETIERHGLNVAAVLSGNRNFDARIHPLVRANYLASPPLVVIYALAGTLLTNIAHEPLGYDVTGHPVRLSNLWPSDELIALTVRQSVRRTDYERRTRDMYAGPPEWQRLPKPAGAVYPWDSDSTVIRCPPFLKEAREADAITGARVLAIFGDGLTTDHILPVGAIAHASPAGRYLQSRGVAPQHFDSYASRRGNHDVMVRAMFANPRLRNEMLKGVEGGMTRIAPSDLPMPIYDAAMSYHESGVPTIIIAGKNYGAGSARDWAAKGTRLIGIRAVVAESFERIHRANLAAMGVLPLQFEAGVTRHTLNLDGSETIDVIGLMPSLAPRQTLMLTITRRDGSTTTVGVESRIDTADEALFYDNGGILPTVLHQLRAADGHAA